MAARGEASASPFAGWAHSMKRAPPAVDERDVSCDLTAIAASRSSATTGRCSWVQSDPAAAAAFADDLVRDWPALQGVVGALAACEAFARRWKASTGRVHSLRAHLRQHSLSAVADVPAAPGAPRVAAEADLPWLIDGKSRSSSRSGFPIRPSAFGPGCRSASRAATIGSGMIAAPAAFAGFNDAAPDFARIAPVYTFPEHRGRGYATALVAAISRELLARGKRRLFLTTDVANPTSNAIYARIGFVAETDDYHFDFVDVRQLRRWRRRVSSFRLRSRPPVVGQSMPLPDGGGASRDARAAACGRRCADDLRRRRGRIRGDARRGYERSGADGAHRRRSIRSSASRRTRSMLAQAVAANDAMDFAIRKAVELGAAAIEPLVTERSAPMPAGERGDKRLAHWRGIVVAACEQCGRNRIPPVAAPVPWQAWAQQWNDAALVLAPGAPAVLASLPRPASPVALAVGPEGGFSDRELEAALKAGLRAVSFGPRVLRTETAGVAALAAMQALWGDLR